MTNDEFVKVYLVFEFEDSCIWPFNQHQ